MSRGAVPSFDLLALGAGVAAAIMVLPPPFAFPGHVQARAAEAHAAPAGGEPGASLTAGGALRDITPDTGDPSRPVAIAGADPAAAATGVHDPLFARALVVVDRAQRGVGLVALDLIGLFHDDVVLIREELKRRHPQVRLDYLAVAGTHTHSGPDVIGLWTPAGRSVDDAYVAHVRSQAVEAVAEAWSRRFPATLAVAEAPAPGEARDTRLPAVIDESVRAMWFESAGGPGRNLSLVVWGAHPTVTAPGATMISADFPRAVNARMEKELGGMSLYASGALGGQIAPGRMRDAQESASTPKQRADVAATIGERIGRIAIRALRHAKHGRVPAEAGVRVRAREVFLPLDNRRFVEGLAAGRIRARRLYPRGGGPEGRLPSELDDRTSLRPGAFSVRSEVAVVEIGSARWVMVPGELYPELAIGGIQDPQDPAADHPGAPRERVLRDLSRAPFFVIGLANDEVGYIIPKSQWDVEPPFAYGRARPQYGEVNSLGPETAPIVMQALAEILSGP